MKNKLCYFALFCLAAFFIVPKIVLGADYSMEKIFYLSEKNAVAGVASLQQNWQKIDIVAPQMYAINSKLLINGKLGPELKKTIQEHNLKTMPLVVNAGFSRAIIHKLLTSPKAQDDVITGLIYLAKKNNYVGWQYDLENISYLDKDLFSAFVEKTYKRFQKNNLIFSVAAVARWSDFENTEAFKSWSGVYDYSRIAAASDFISYMTYDDPNSLGPVASLDFDKKCLDYVKDKIPAKKLSFGVPLYYWVWNADTNKRVGSGFFKSVAAVMKKYEYNLAFDEALGVSWLSYIYNNKNYKIWFEDQQSLQKKLEIIKANGLRGFSAWVLGDEDPNIWKIL